jgi:hypothetical protein
MRTPVRGTWIAALMLVGAAAAGQWLGSATERLGQIVFVPGDPGTVTVATLGPVTVTYCEENSEGLLVRGHVETTDRITGVLVSPGDAKSSGVALSAGYIASAGLIPGAVPGDFEVTLGWATVGSTFAVVDPDSIASGSLAPEVGPPGTCPR